MIADEDKIFPDTEGLEPFLQSWYELGLASSNGMGQTPLSYSEIEAYSRTVDYLTPFEVSTIRKMSNAYCYGMNNGKEKGAFAPYPRYKEVDVTSKLRNALDFLKQPQRQKAKIR